MTQEEKDLLLKDLCGRLPYDTIIEITDKRGDEELVYTEVISCAEVDMLMHDEKEIKPYLRPMESMTEGERRELLYKLSGKYGEKFKITKTGRVIEKENKKSWDFRNQSNFELVSFIDFCPKSISTYESFMYSHHFDSRGLIEKGLAIAVTEENNPYKQSIMEATNLMIGDWVRIKSDIEPDDAYWLHDDMQPGQVLKVTEILSNGINPDWYGGEINDYVPEDAIEPIPLTAEILEKNRMKPFEIDKLTDKATAKWWSKNGDFFIKQYHFKHQDYQPIFSLGCHNHTLIEGIQYVHELQHALRLCGIEKDITIQPMDFISDGWREEIEEAIKNVPIMMSGNAYTDGFKDGLKKAIEILENHIQHYEQIQKEIDL